MIDILSGLKIGFGSGSKWGLVSTNTEASILYGVNTHFGQGIAEYSNVNGCIDEVAALGLNAIRDNVNWSHFEQSAGVYTFGPAGDSRSQRMFTAWARNAAQGYGIHTTLGALYGNSALYGSTADATWIGHFCDAMESMTQAYVDAGYDPALLAIELWNEPMGPASVEFDAVSEADDYANALVALSARVKAIDSSIQVYGGVMADNAWGGRIAWNNAMWAVPGWSQAIDGYSDHPYWTLLIPEETIFLSEKWCRDTLQEAAVADGRLTTLPWVATEFGWDTTQYTNAVATKYIPRAFALFSAMPYTHNLLIYELVNTSGQTYGLSTSLGSRKTQATAIAAMMVHLNLASRRSYYWSGGLANGGDHAVLLDVSGGQRLVVWTLEGTRELTITVNSMNGPGTLSIETVGGATATQALAAGQNAITVELTDTAKVLYADVAIGFPEFA